MSTKNIECQLAQGQIGRYPNGERFSNEAIKQLESHVADCDECSELVSRRRQALLAMLGERNKNLAVVSPASMPEAKSEPIEDAVPALKTKAEPAQTAEVATAPTKTQMLAQLMSSKPLLYSSALAVVLLAMSYFSHGALKVFGPTADIPAVAEKPIHHTAAPVATPASTPITPAATHPASVAATTPVPKPTTVHPAAIVDNTKSPDNTKVADNADATNDNSTGTNDSSDTADATPAPAVVAPVKHVVAHRTTHRARPKAKARRIVRTARRAQTHRVARRAVKIRARKISSHQRVAMNTRHRPVHAHHVSGAITSGVRIYDPSGRPLQ